MQVEPHQIVNEEELFKMNYKAICIVSWRVRQIKFFN